MSFGPSPFTDYGLERPVSPSRTVPRGFTRTKSLTDPAIRGTGCILSLRVIRHAVIPTPWRPDASRALGTWPHPHLRRLRPVADRGRVGVVGHLRHAVRFRSYRPVASRCS